MRLTPPAMLYDDFENPLPLAFGGSGITLELMKHAGADVMIARIAG